MLPNFLVNLMTINNILIKINIMHRLSKIALSKVLFDLLIFHFLQKGEKLLKI